MPGPLPPAVLEAARRWGPALAGASLIVVGVAAELAVLPIGAALLMLALLLGPPRQSAPQPPAVVAVADDEPTLDERRIAAKLRSLRERLDA